MTPQENATLGVLAERLANLIQRLDEYMAVHEKRHKEFMESNERRHRDAELALEAHIKGTLPIINAYQQFQGEWRVTKAGLWLMATALFAIVVALTTEFVKRN